MEKDNNKGEKLYDRFLIFIDSLEIATVSINPQMRFDYKFIIENYKEVDSISNEKVHRVTEDIYLIRKYTRVKGYANNYEIIIDGMHIGNFLFNHRKDDPIVKLKIANNILYKEQYIDYIEIILNTFSLSYHYTSYLEISYDSIVDTTKRFADFYFSSSKFEYATEKRFKHKGNSVINSIENGKTFIVGKSDAKKIVLYNKSKEIYHSKKGYIRELHEANAFTGEVHRIEARLKKKFLKKYDYDLTFLMKLDDPDFLKDLFVTSVGDNLTFIDLNKYLYINRNKKCIECHVISLEKVSKRKLTPHKKPTSNSSQKSYSYEYILKEIKKELKNYEPKSSAPINPATLADYRKNALKKIKNALKTFGKEDQLSLSMPTLSGYLNTSQFCGMQLANKPQIDDCYYINQVRLLEQAKEECSIYQIFSGETMQMPVMNSVNDTLS